MGERVNWTKMVATKGISGPGQHVQYNQSEIANASFKKKKKISRFSYI